MRTTAELLRRESEKGGEIIITTLIPLVIIAASAALLVAPLALVIWARLIANRTRGASLSDRSLYATVILREVQSPAHRLMQRDPEYRKSLFQRYAPLLQKDMELVLEKGGFVPRIALWGCFFRVYYSLLRMHRVPAMLGLEREGLLILLGAMLPVLRTAESRA